MQHNPAPQGIYGLVGETRYIDQGGIITDSRGSKCRVTELWRQVADNEKNEV